MDVGCSLGEQPHDLASRLPTHAYDLAKPMRSGIVFAAVNHACTNEPLEAYLTPEFDVLSLHTTSFGAETWVDGKMRHRGAIRAGQISLAPALVKSEVKLEGDIGIIQVFLPPQAISAASAELFGVARAPRIQLFEEGGCMAELIVQAACAAHSPDPAAHLRADYLALQLCEQLLTRFGDDLTSGHSRHGGLPPWQMRRAMDYMEDHMSEPVGLEEVATLLGISRFHLIRAFQSSTGVTPHRWLYHRRIRRAKAMLAHGHISVSTIATAVGYRSVSSLSAAFSQATGMSPRAWRKERSRYSSR